MQFFCGFLSTIDLAPLFGAYFWRKTIFCDELMTEKLLEDFLETFCERSPEKKDFPEVNNAAWVSSCSVPTLGAGYILT
jgi:hypothetical protein